MNIEVKVDTSKVDKMLSDFFMPIDAHGNLVPKMQRKVKNYVEEALNDEISKLNGHT